MFKMRNSLLLTLMMAAIAQNCFAPASPVHGWDIKIKNDTDAQKTCQVGYQKFPIEPQHTITVSSWGWASHLISCYENTWIASLHEAGGRTSDQSDQSSYHFVQDTSDKYLWHLHKK